MISYFIIGKKKQEPFHHSHAGPFSERPTKAKSLSLRSPATCLIKYNISCKEPCVQCISNSRSDSKLICVITALTGKGSAPSWITKPSMRWVRTWGLTTAWGTGALSLSPSPTLDRGRGRDKVGGEGKLAATGGASGGRRNNKNNISTKLLLQIMNVWFGDGRLTYPNPL